MRESNPRSPPPQLYLTTTGFTVQRVGHLRKTVGAVGLEPTMPEGG